MEWLIGLIFAVIVYIIMQSSKNVDKTYQRSKRQPKQESKQRHFSIAEKTLNQDSNLSDFRINVTKSITQPSTINNQSLGKWIAPSQTIKIHNYLITGGLFYCGERLKGLDGFQTDACLVNATLQADSNNPDYCGDMMGYWPNFGDISPQSRAAYLAWLASDRNDPTCYIGYVFLYFYGLERRLLVDGGQLTNSERDVLVDELKRLRKVYGGNRSFNGYVTSLLAHIWGLYYRGQSVDLSLLTAKHDFTTVFKLALAQAVAASKPISAALALAWVTSHPEHTLRTPARRCVAEFGMLFKLRYQAVYGEGLVIKPNKTRLRLEYIPANRSLFGYQSTTLDLPDVSRLKSPFKKLLSLAEDCTDALDAYSRFVGKPENDKTSLLAAAYLPDDVVSLLQHKRFEQLKAWLIAQAKQPLVVLPTSDLLTQLGADAPVKINKKEAEILAGLVEKAGFGLVPDVRFHHAKPTLDGKVVLFSGGHGDNFQPSHAFNQLGTILHLGALVAAIDQQIDPAEVAFLERVIADEMNISNIERASLQAYLHWRLYTPISMAGLKTKIATINQREKTAISHILISVALADGNLDATEIKQLEKLYTSLGLDKSQVSRDVHALATQVMTPQPPTPEQTIAVAQPDFTLNRERLKTYQTETKGVQSILETIFVSDSVDDEPEVPVMSETLSITGLSSKHQQLYTQLVIQAQWSLAEVETLCKSLNLMTDGAIEVINDWAFDQVGAPVIDGGSTVFIDLDVVQEINTA